MTYGDYGGQRQQKNKANRRPLAGNPKYEILNPKRRIPAGRDFIRYPASPKVCLGWFFMLTISLAKMLAVPRANIEKTISIGPKKKTTAAPIVQPAKGHSTISRSLLFLVPGSNSNIAIPDAKPAPVTTGADSQQRTFANKGPYLSTAMATANQPT